MKPQSKIASFFNVLFVNFRHFKFISGIEDIIKKMKPAERIIFYLVSCVFVISSFILIVRVNNSFLVEVPSFGGKFTEGLVGSPRFINPILAISNTDKDLSSLVYSGLLKASSDGQLTPDIANGYEVKEEGKVYEFKIKDSAKFHDGKPVTADDVVFTIGKTVDPIIKSPKRASWENVLVEKVDDKTVRFTLSKPYSPFLENLTLGILPKHIWENATSEEFPFSEFNVNPIGSGPYKVERTSRNSGGIPTSITFSAFKDYVFGKPKISSITFKFFQNENEVIKAYEEESIDSLVGLSDLNASRMASNNLIKESSLPRVFGVFFNQNVAPVFLNKEVREALLQATPKQRIVDEVLYGFGKVLNGPTPENIETDFALAQGDLELASTTLAKAGWKPNANGVLEKKTKTGNVVLSFSISTSDTPELKRTAEILKESWEKLGAAVTIKVFESGDLSQNVIRGRKYDALLFGEVVNKESDLYPFWHSSERNDPGLNVSLYANITADKMLEDLQKEIDPKIIEEKKQALLNEIKQDRPAIFLFSPNLLYLKPKNVKNISLKDISSESERFLSVSNWYIETDKVWKIFAY